MAKVFIASDSPGIREYLIEDCSLTVPFHDPKALASAISELLNSNELAKMGATAREHAVRKLEMRQYVQALSSEMLGISNYRPDVLPVVTSDLKE
jgi:glycosyltransferase involved in cell wall biosynthesis